MSPQCRETQKKKDRQGIAEQLVLDQMMFIYPESERSPVMVGQPSLEWIKVLAVNEPETVFMPLAHRFNVNDHLCAAFVALRYADIKGSVPTGGGGSVSASDSGFGGFVLG